MQNESVTQIDYRHPLPAIVPGTMATYRKPYTNHGARCWRPIACLIVNQGRQTVRIRIAGFVRGQRTFREVSVNRLNLYPLFASPLIDKEEYIKAGIMERVTKRVLAEVNTTLKTAVQNG